MAKTSISAGDLIYQALTGDAELTGLVTAVYPVIEPVDDVPLPYIVYAATGMQANPTKPGRGSDRLVIQVEVYAEDYLTSVSIAEAVREALDNNRLTVNGLTLKASTLTDRREEWVAGAYAQFLTFELLIS